MRMRIPEKITRQLVKGAGVPVLVLLLIGLSGCASAGYRKSDAAANSLREAQLRVNTESQAVSSAMGCLNDLVNNPARDLKPPFVLFSKSVDRLASTSVQADSSAVKMRQKFDAYLKAWDEQIPTIQYEAVRKNSQTRREEVGAEFEALHRRFLETQSAVRPLVGYLQDIRSALGTDLTTGGLDAVKGVVANAGNNSSKVQTALDKLSQELAKVGSQMTSLPSESAK